MSLGLISDRTDSRLGTQGRLDRRWRDLDEREQLHDEDRERPYGGDDHPARDRPQRRRGGKHGCDRIRGQGTRRHLD